MVGTSNLGSWNGPWTIVIHCVNINTGGFLKKSATSKSYIYIYFFNRIFHYKPSSHWGSPMETLRWPKWPAAWWTKNWWSRAGSRSRKPPRKPSRHAKDNTCYEELLQYTIWMYILQYITHIWCKYKHIYKYLSIYLYIYICICICIKLYNAI